MRTDYFEHPITYFTLFRPTHSPRAPHPPPASSTMTFPVGSQIMAEEIDKHKQTNTHTNEQTNQTCSTIATNNSNNDINADHTTNNAQHSNKTKRDKVLERLQPRLFATYNLFPTCFKHFVLVVVVLWMDGLQCNLVLQQMQKTCNKKGHMQHGPTTSTGNLQQQRHNTGLRSLCCHSIALPCLRGEQVSHLTSSSLGPIQNEPVSSSFGVMYKNRTHQHNDG